MYPTITESQAAAIAIVLGCIIASAMVLFFYLAWLRKRDRLYEMKRSRHSAARSWPKIDDDDLEALGESMASMERRDGRSPSMTRSPDLRVTEDDDSWPTVSTGASSSRGSSHASTFGGSYGDSGGSSSSFSGGGSSSSFSGGSE